MVSKVELRRPLSLMGSQSRFRTVAAAAESESFFDFRSISASVRGEAGVGGRRCGAIEIMRSPGCGCFLRSTPPSQSSSILPSVLTLFFMTDALFFSNVILSPAHSCGRVFRLGEE
jgi:hypothetical protein